jgi:hypothetical protein
MDVDHVDVSLQGEAALRTTPGTTATDGGEE